jgi:hypothetical protein
MNTIQISQGSAISSDGIFRESSVWNKLLWKNLVIEKKISVNWIYKIFKHSLLYDFWTVWSSAVR